MAQVAQGGCRIFIYGHLEKQVGRASQEQQMNFASCLWAQGGTAQPLPVPPSSIFHRFYPLVFFSRAPAARRPDPGGQWRFPDWGHKREVPHPDGNFPFLLLWCDSGEWLRLGVCGGHQGIPLCAVPKSQLGNYQTERFNIKIDQ